MPRTPAEKLNARVARLRARLARRDGLAILWQALGKALIERTYTLGTFEYAAAEAAYRRSLALAPTDAFSHLYLGNLFYGRRLYRRSLHWFESSRRLLPNDPIAYVNIAESHAILGHHVLADQFFQKAVELDPGDDNAQRHLAHWLEWLETRSRASDNDSSHPRPPGAG